MKRVKIAELKARLSEHLRAVQGGDEIVVTDRGHPIAMIVPYSEGVQRIRWIRRSRPFSDSRSRRYPAADWAVESTQLLLEDRRKR